MNSETQVSVKDDDRIRSGRPTRSPLHWSIKVAVFVCTIMSLSWFFAGWRQIHEANNLTSWSVLIGGTVLTFLLLSIQGYWIYFEEKAKGNLRKRVELFERVNAMLEGASKS